MIKIKYTVDQIEYRTEVRMLAAQFLHGWELCAFGHPSPDRPADGIVGAHFSARDAGWDWCAMQPPEDREDWELAEDIAHDWAQNYLYSQDAGEPEPDTPSLDVEGFWFNAGF